MPFLWTYFDEQTLPLQDHTPVSSTSSQHSTSANTTVKPKEKAPTSWISSYGSKTDTPTLKLRRNYYRINPAIYFGGKLQMPVDTFLNIMK